MTQYAIKNAEYILSAPEIDLLPESETSEIAFIGRSNVGKSSLLNFLMGRRTLARVSRTPGRTRALNLFSAVILKKDAEGKKQEKAFNVIDLPGVGYARLSLKERASLSQLLSDYVDSDRPIGLILHLFDCRRDINDEDLELSYALRKSQTAYVGVMTKIDQVPISKRRPLLKRFAEILAIDEGDCLMTSTNDNIGRDAILSVVWEKVS